MNKTQIFFLAAVFFIMGNMFIYLDVTHGFMGMEDPCANIYIDDLERSRELLEQNINGTITDEELRERIGDTNSVSDTDLICELRGNIYAPFIWTFYMLFIAFLTLGIIESIRSSIKKKKKHSN